MATKVGINGFGRIGRNIMRAALGSKDIDFVAVNDLTSAATLAHLLKYDSILGNLESSITASNDRISVDGDDFQVLSVKDPAQLPWKDLGVDRRRDRGRRSDAGTQGQARRNLDAGADAERLVRRPGRAPRQEDDRRRSERGVQGRGERPAEGASRGRRSAAGLDRLPRQPA